MRTTTVSQGFVSYRPSGLATRRKGRAGGAKARPASRRVDPLAFLSTKIQPIPITDTELLSVSVDEAYRKLSKGLSRFYKTIDRTLKMPHSGKTSERLCQLVEFAQEDLKVLNLELCTKKVDDELQFVLYRTVQCLDEQVLVFYLAPADYLPLEMSGLYRRYVKYIATSLGLSVMPTDGDNYYIDLIVNFDAEEMEDAVGDPAYEKASWMNVLYDLGGEFYQKFEQIRDMANNPDVLRRDLVVYLKKTKDSNIARLVNVMLCGMEILPYMFIGNYFFNPWDDSLDGSNDGCIDLTSTIAFLYSRHDGMEERLLDSINNDCYCGLVGAGWNKHLHIDTDYSDDDLMRLMSDDTMEHRFRDWMNDYYEAIEKFDCYGTDRLTEREA